MAALRGATRESWEGHDGRTLVAAVEMGSVHYGGCCWSSIVVRLAKGLSCLTMVYTRWVVQL